MEDNANIYKLKTHPQISAPFKFITTQLNDLQYPYEVVGVKPEDLKPTQPFVDNDQVASMADMLRTDGEFKPIWISQNNDILDGHHRYAAHMLTYPEGNIAVPAIRLLCNTKKALEILGNIEEEFKKTKLKHSQSKILHVLGEEDDSMYLPSKKFPTKKETVQAYRREPMKKAITGNWFFLTKPSNEYKGFNITFTNLLSTDAIDKKIGSCKNASDCVKGLFQLWYPSLNIKEKAKESGMSENSFINAIVAERARIEGIDGIKYGNKLLQSIDDK